MQIELKDLKESTDFLNLLLDNIDAAILIADEDLRIRQFNRSFLDLFDTASDQIVDQAFGPVSGCVNAVKENQPCGATSMCRFCTLRNASLESLLGDVPVDRKRLERTFYIEGRPVKKHLEFSSRVIRFEGRKMILVIISDLSEIEERKRALEEKQTQIEHDLKMAAKIQQSLLPDTSAVFPNLRAAWRFEPCQEIGGDIFHIEAIDGEMTHFYTLDVCGHGVSAALVSVSVAQFLSTLHNRMRLTGHPFSPETVMERLDRAFPMDRFDCFFSIAYATVNTRTGLMTYSNGGHMPPLLLRADGTLEPLTVHNTVIGVGAENVFLQERRQLEAGDRVILYTDGLVENFGLDGERHGKQLLYEALTALSQRPVEAFVGDVIDRLHRSRSGRPPTDDVSLIAVEYAGRDGSRPT